MQQLAADIWIEEGPSVPFLGLPFSTRMTVVRLANGKLWVHSPIELNDSIRAELANLGELSYLIAPNHLHHLFIGDWLKTYPKAQAYGTDELIKKRSDIRFTASLNAAQDWPWAEQIDQLLFSGSALMQECVFFHRPSATLVLTDLVENFAPSHFNFWQRSVAKLVGIVAPNGKTPLDWRLSFFFHKAEAAQHFKQMLAWQPQKVVMAHGLVIEQDAQAFLSRSFSWLNKHA
ncbi:DUF4336 domain-containing protein [Agarivorans gilvus]|uniref:DUF4336 domain-containing protein n=1 Tax=Agarivorans gilvus TaxID=680279 RepID=A0ABQ1I7Y4_9ALTE|nr:DUF4336 domain-containing protein [Agarivorans gilvus]GGB20025.1 hypothetical protein GCM10007414_36800 [Agarivorans gilvus]